MGAFVSRDWGPAPDNKDWDDQTAWNDGASGYPQAGDDVTHDNGKAINVVDDAACASLTVGATTADTRLVLPEPGGQTLAVSGNVTIGANGNVFGDIGFTAAMSYLRVGGNLSLNASCNIKDMRAIWWVLEGTGNTLTWSDATGGNRIVRRLRFASGARYNGPSANPSYLGEVMGTKGAWLKIDSDVQLSGDMSSLQLRIYSDNPYLRLADETSFVDVADDFAITIEAVRLYAHGVYGAQSLVNIDLGGAWTVTAYVMFSATPSETYHWRRRLRVHNTAGDALLVIHNLAPTMVVTGLVDADTIQLSAGNGLSPKLEAQGWIGCDTLLAKMYTGAGTVTPELILTSGAVVVRKALTAYTSEAGPAIADMTISGSGAPLVVRPVSAGCVLLPDGESVHLVRLDRGLAKLTASDTLVVPGDFTALAARLATTVGATTAALTLTQPGVAVGGTLTDIDASGGAPLVAYGPESISNCTNVKREPLKHRRAVRRVSRRAWMRSVA